MAIDTLTNTETADAPSAEHERLFRYSAWLHVGEGATDCEEGQRGGCRDAGHYHLWCRLPNKLQYREIRDHALAARARKARQLRDPSTTGYEILEADLDAIARRGDEARDDLVAELLNQHWAEDFLKALADVKTAVEGDDEDERLVWEHIDDDKARYEELTRDLDRHPTLADTDEYKELQARMLAFNDAVEDAYAKRQTPRRDGLDGLDVNALLDRVRDLRIDAHAQDEFNHTYSVWEWATCTRRTVGGATVWGAPAGLEDLPDEVIEGLQSTYDALEKAQREDVSPGNS